MTAILLNCTVKPGMFSDESVIELATADGRELAFFVPRSVVSGAAVKVDLVKSSGGVNWIILPTAEPNNAIPVRDDQLRKIESLSA
jgi:hypothetical protein